jgi:hypothetical protein
MKLYKVTLRGMTVTSTGVVYGVSYAVAEDPTSAFSKVKKFLDTNDIGFSKERELLSIELVADTNIYPSCGTILHL